MHPAAYQPAHFDQIGVIRTWQAYMGRLSWGREQCLAILDDGCDLTAPPWKVNMPWAPKVAVSYNSIDGNDDPTPVSPGYHGTSVGYPSSLLHEGTGGVAYNNYVAQVRCVSIVHMDGQTEADSMADALKWVVGNHRTYNITAVNLSPLDDERHKKPVPTPIDAPLRQLREMGIWVSAPCGNNGYTDGISWPACQPFCFGIGATRPNDVSRIEQEGEPRVAHLDRFENTDLLVAADATSSSNACAAACAMVLREAIQLVSYEWGKHGENLADAMMCVFRETGNTVEDVDSGFTYQELQLDRAVDAVMNA